MSHAFQGQPGGARSSIIGVDLSSVLSKPDIDIIEEKGHAYQQQPPGGIGGGGPGADLMHLPIATLHTEAAAIEGKDLCQRYALHAIGGIGKPLAAVAAIASFSVSTQEDDVGGIGPREVPTLKVWRVR